MSILKDKNGVELYVMDNVRNPRGDIGTIVHHGEYLCIEYYDKTRMILDESYAKTLEKWIVQDTDWFEGRLVQSIDASTKMEIHS